MSREKYGENNNFEDTDIKDEGNYETLFRQLQQEWANTNRGSTGNRALS